MPPGSKRPIQASSGVPNIGVAAAAEDDAGDDAGGDAGGGAVPLVPPPLPSELVLDRWLGLRDGRMPGAAPAGPMAPPRTRKTRIAKTRRAREGSVAGWQAADRHSKTGFVT